MCLLLLGAGHCRLLCACASSLKALYRRVSRAKPWAVELMTIVRHGRHVSRCVNTLFIRLPTLHTIYFGNFFSLPPTPTISLLPSLVSDSNAMRKSFIRYIIIDINLSDELKTHCDVGPPPRKALHTKQDTYFIRCLAALRRLFGCATRYSKSFRRTAENCENNGTK